MNKGVKLYKTFAGGFTHPWVTNEKVNVYMYNDVTYILMSEFCRLVACDSTMVRLRGGADVVNIGRFALRLSDLPGVLERLLCWSNDKITDAMKQFKVEENTLDAIRNWQGTLPPKKRKISIMFQPPPGDDSFIIRIICKPSNEELEFRTN